MSPEHKAKVSEMLAACGVVYNREVTELLIKTFWMMLDGHDIAEITYAFKMHLDTCKFFPTPAHILENMTPKEDSDAEAALALSRYNSGDWPSEDPITNRTIISLGGSWDCKQMPAGVFTGLFRKTYAALHRAGMKEKLSLTRGFLGEGEAVPRIDLNRELLQIRAAETEDDEHEDFGSEIGDEDTHDLDGNLKDIANKWII